MTDDELDQVETDELIAALRRRSTASVVALMNDMDNQRQSKIVYYGGGVTALGLIEYAKLYVGRDFLEPHRIKSE